ncbi:phenylacetate-CoA oxygenase/reductase subunit PaaK [Rhodobacteraceae bacterium RKSG542]|uniref:1,2-phenylacetyl-CoA epoxidase subunit PaaE n=1 Tax=Pseudovibrio flavus TaxID=2529854 RepID=UPI0012BB8C38|nr:1,2-phenylacetyl-CoA epoxidase subunit PaaE [Pseudovibrio flavus]MTI16245.1 phenylacetate-CoA oxygenase/reductase subunit PaaK [Pseudovibrio flavus]
MALQFHSLKIRSVRKETEDAVSVAFAVPDALQEAFQFQAGQYLTVRQMIDGDDTRRSYSICAAHKPDEVRIAIKKVEGGRFSTHALDTFKEGLDVDVMPPTGRFTLAGDGERSGKIYAGFAAGSGITPIMSMIETTLSQDDSSRFFLFYGNKSSGSIMFKQKLEDLKDRFMDRLCVYHFLSQEETDLSLLHGRLDAEKIDELLTTVLPANHIEHAYLCGPGSLVEAGREVLLKNGLSAEQVHSELFTPAGGAAPVRKDQTLRKDSGVTGSKASIILDGNRHSVTVEGDDTILQAALNAGLEVPYSCTAGMCCTCRARVTKGEVDMAVNYSLEPWEVEAGYVLTCQSRPKGESVSVDYDDV